jgi:hypothetical protein
VKTDATEPDSLLNYKGIYFAENDEAKYTCPVTGAHFEFMDMCRRLKLLQQQRDLSLSINKRVLSQRELVIESAVESSSC